MAHPNGRIPVSALQQLPLSWSNKNREESLTAAAAASLSRMMLRAVAATGSDFAIWDAYRNFNRQVAMLRLNYRRVSRARSRPSDRSYDGSTWELRPGRPLTASPGYSNHGEGISVDIHPGEIQQWLAQNAARFGWVNDVPSEPWHWSYLNPGADRYRAEGWVDHAEIQEALDVTVTARFDAATVAAVREYQKTQGLTVDGIPGPKTLGPLLGDDVVPDATVTDVKIGEVLPRSAWTDTPVDAVRLADHPERVQKGAYVHWPAMGDVTCLGKSREWHFDWLRRWNNQHRAGEFRDIAYSRAHFQDGTRVELRGLDHQAGGNGGTTSNRSMLAFLAVIGDHEDPTPELIASLHQSLTDARDLHPEATILLPHHMSPDASTECCGPRLSGIILGKATPVKAETPKLTADGRLGTLTVMELQRFLNTAINAGLKVDGRAGPLTWRALQTYLGTRVDGVVSRQSYRAEELGNGIVPGPGWEHTGRRSSGSTMVRALQGRLGITQDGTWFEATTKPLQLALNRGRL